MANGAPRIEFIPLSELTERKAKRNPKSHDPSIGASIERFGFNDPPALDEGTGRLVEGHGRVAALAERKVAGKDPPARVLIRSDGEWMVPVLRGLAFKDEKEAEAYLLAHNQTSAAGGWDNPELAKMLAEQKQNLDGLGWKELEVNRLLGNGDTDLAAEWKGMPEFIQEDKLAQRQIILNFASDQAVRQFAELLGQSITDKTRSLWFPKAEIDYVADLRYKQK